MESNRYITEQEKRKFNILYVMATLDIGGTIQQLILLFKNLLQKYNISFCCITRGGPLLDRVKETGVNVFILEKRFKIDLSVIWNLYTLIKRQKVDILHTFLFTSNTFARIAGILAGVPVIISSERNVDSWKGLHHKIIDMILEKFTDRIIVNSKSVEDFYKKSERVPRHKIITIYNGIDVDEWNPENINGDIIRRRFNISGERLVVGSIGQLKPAKGYQYYLEAASIVLKRFPDVVFCLVGDGKERERLEEIKNNLGLGEKFVFIGEDINIKPYFAMFDIFVCPSLREGHPNTLLEAMAMAKPIVGTDVDGISETISNWETGLLVPSENAHGLAEGIEYLIEHRDLARETGLRARHYVKQHYSSKNMIESTENIYKELVARKLIRD